MRNEKSTLTHDLLVSVMIERNWETMMFKNKEHVVNGDTAPMSKNSTVRKVWPFPGKKCSRGVRSNTTPVMIRHVTPDGARIAENLNSVERTKAWNVTPMKAANETEDSESFHNAIRGILVTAQIFGILPVSGVRSTTPLKLSYTLLSFRSAYALIILSMILLMAVISVLHMIKTLNTDTFSMHGGITTATAGAVFYGNSLISNLLFFRLSPRWVPLQRDWRAMESYLDSNKTGRPKLRWKFTMISCTVLLLALAEHILSICNNTIKFEWSKSNLTFQNFLEVYCTASHSFILNILNYNYALGIFLFLISKVATFTWNFTDLFVMLISTGLAERYKSLNKWMISYSSKDRHLINWRELREDYAILSSMVKKVDNEISPIILLSFANNLYFICLQLLNGLSPDDGNFVGSLYFFSSFAFLIGRTVAVTLFTARIHDQSKLALPTLYNCAAASFDAETQRLQYQLTTDDISLTGLRFFSITRNFMLAVSILAYFLSSLLFLSGFLRATGCWGDYNLRSCTATIQYCNEQVRYIDKHCN
ncbi:gustatory receptor for sugar taste 64e-like isoform X2 [Prorops nasuta]|uniref:gustatory receptor for sugar taste 64e-like isoform X2 n=1 Tax=Prorops nasuta TaxID=863751 RepID=UPI0034CF6D8A